MIVKDKKGIDNLQKIEDDQEKLHFSLRSIEKKKKSIKVHTLVYSILLIAPFLFLILFIIKVDIFMSIITSLFTLLYFLINLYFINQDS